MRIWVYTKTLNQQLDEAISKMAYEISTRVLAKSNDVLTLYSSGNLSPNETFIKVPNNPLLLITQFKVRKNRTKPDLVLFIPRASASLTNLLIGRLIKWRWGAKKLVILVLQPNAFGVLSKKFARFVRPDLIVTASVKIRDELIRLGCQSKFVSIGVDCQKFKPADSECKINLRRRFGISQDAFVILHVGHLNKFRNIGLLKSMQRNDQQVVIVGSSSTPQDVALCNDLRSVGIKIITEYLERIEEVYQLSDCYVFPTLRDLSCISIPVSVQEAMACNLPVISTRFEGLTDIYPVEGNGLLYANNEVEMLDRLEYLKNAFDSSKVDTRRMVHSSCNEIWDEEFTHILEIE